MSKKLLALLLCAGLLLCAAPVSQAGDIAVEPPEEGMITLVEPCVNAQGSCGNGLSWTLEGGTLTISGSGAMFDWNDADYPPWYEYRGEITQAVLQSGVANVGAYAFYGCTALRSVTLPEGLWGFGYQSFRDCVSLTELEIPASVCELGALSFYGSGLRSVRVPDGVTRLTGCFAYCAALETAELGSGVTALDDLAFRGCTALKSVTLPEGLTEIGVAAFRDCAALRELQLPASLRKLSLWSFYGSGLTELTLPEGLTETGEQSFRDCAALGRVSLPASLTEVAYMSFAGCGALPEIEIPAAVKKVANKAFAECGALTDLAFAGDAPEFFEFSFRGVTATATYPAGNESWTEAVRQNYGGQITWLPRLDRAGPAPRLSEASTAGAALVWDAVEGADSYELQRFDNGVWQTLQLAPGCAYTDAAAPMGRALRYRLRARIGGAVTAWGEELALVFNPFADVSGKKTLEYVAWAYNEGIIRGTGPHRFSPNAPCSRLQFVMMLWKMHGSPTVGGDPPFDDVSGSKATRAILWALDRGVIKRAKSFDPDGDISRVQIVMMLWKLAGSPEVSGDNPFTDVSGEKTTKAVLWAYQNGITKGVSDTRFAPDRACSRVQLVVFLYKYNRAFG